jgi:hypothetical protein
VKTDEGLYTEMKKDTKPLMEQRISSKGIYKRPTRRVVLRKRPKNIWKRIEEPKPKTKQVTLEGKEITRKLRLRELEPEQVLKTPRELAEEPLPKGQKTLFKKKKKPKRIEEYEEYYEPLTEVKYTDAAEYPTIGDYPGSGVQYPIRKGGYAAAYGYRGKGDFIDDTIHSHWQDKAPYFDRPKGPRYTPPKRDMTPGTTSFRIPTITEESKKVSGVKAAGMLDSSQEALGEIARERIDLTKEPAYDFERAEDIMKETLPIQKQAPALATGSALRLQQRTDLLSPQIVTEVPITKTPEYMVRQEKSSSKFRFPLPDDEKKKREYYRRYGRRMGIGYKERFYKVKGFELGKKRPTYIRIVK